jgi:recombination protein RecR
MDAFNKLTEYFSEFPGIGPRQAKRFAYFLLTRNQNYLDELSRNIAAIKDAVTLCTSCYRFFLKDSPKTAVCSICANKNRDTSTRMVVSRDVDLDTIEKAGVYNGLYFVLGGSIPILEKNPERRIRAAELVSMLENNLKQGVLKEIIFALNANPEGENTQYYLEKFLEPLKEQYNVKLSTLGRGLSTGTELEYSDGETIKNALKNRQ